MKNWRRSCFRSSLSGAFGERSIKSFSGGSCWNALPRDRFREFVPSDHVYDEIFDRFEYLFALIWIDESIIGARLDRVPLGRFAWKEVSVLQGGASIEGKMSAEVSQQGKDWPAFRAGLVGCSTLRLLSGRNRVATFIGPQQNRVR